MKTLFVTTKSPLPVNDGHSLRSFNLLKAVAEHHDVTLLSFVKFPVEWGYRKELEKFCSVVKLFRVADNGSVFRAALSAGFNIAGKLPYVAVKYNQRLMREEIRRLLLHENFDLVHLDMLPLGRFLNEIDIPVLLDEHNVESALLKRRCDSIINPVAKWYLKEQQRRLQLFETDVARRVTQLIACSEEDKLILESMAPGKPITVVPNGVDTDFYQPSDGEKAKAGNIVFVGGMNWFPNRDGVHWFTQTVLPQVVKLEPLAMLHVVGRCPENLRKIHLPHVTMHGFVEDTRPYLEQSEIAVVPIRVGGGTRLKVLEAMSMGKAIVSTTVGVEGIQVRDRQHVLIANTPDDFALAILELLRNVELRRNLGDAARRLVCDRYRWDKIGQRLLDVYLQAGRNHAPR